jgi:hypothetical protein
VGERLLRELQQRGYHRASKLRDELLNGEIFTGLHEAEVLIESWRRHYNAVWPHSSQGHRPPAPEAILPPAGWPALRSAQPTGGPTRPDRDSRTGIVAGADHLSLVYESHVAGNYATYVFP